MASNLVLDSHVASAKSTVWWLYIVHAISFVFSLGMFSFIPLIINYVKRPDTAGTFVYSHHSWQIRSFWWYLVWSSVAYHHRHSSGGRGHGRRVAVEGVPPDQRRGRPE